MLAVNELLTNAARHGGGDGEIALWKAGQSLVCEVTDHGGGFDERDLHQRPAADVPGGWGLWLADELTDELTIKSGEEGTTVRISSQVF